MNGAAATTFAYDLDGLLVRAGDLFLARNAANGLLNGSSLGGIEEIRDHSVLGEPSRVAVSALGIPLFETLYARDKLGRITRKTETIDGATTVAEYGFDLGGRLETVTIDGLLTAAYSWDRNGNRLSAATPGGTAIASYDAQDRLLAHGSATFTYNAAGELATKADADGTTTYQYDPLGNLRRVDLPDGRVIEYLIDGRNRRVGKKIDCVQLQGFVYRDQLNPVAELDGAGNEVARFVYGSKAHVPDYMTRGGDTYRIVSDHLGSPRLVINTATGAIAQRMDFDEWGNVTLDTAPGFQPFGFAGGILDVDTGLTRFGARDYDATVGRWTAKDPIGFGGGDANLYAYVGGDPINGIDPAGLFWGGPMRTPQMSWPWPSPLPQNYGLSLGASTVNPLTSGGGGNYGINLQRTADCGWNFYLYFSPNNSTSLGFNPGLSLQGNVATGSGPWAGLFDGVGASAGPVSAGYFQTPSSDPEAGYAGLSLGIGVGTPIGAEAAQTYYVSVPPNACGCN